MNGSTILMLGDSLIDFGHWQSRLPQYNIISKGLPGERAEELLRRLPSCRNHTSVKAVVIMTGTNNLLTSQNNFTDTIDDIVVTLQTYYASAKILLTSLVPFQISGFKDLIIRANRELQIITQNTGTRYFDLYRPFENHGTSVFDFDGVHFSETGYTLWAQLLTEELSMLLAKDSD